MDAIVIRNVNLDPDGRISTAFAKVGRFLEANHAMTLPQDAV